MEKASLDPKTQKRAKRMATIQRRLFLAETVLTVLYLLCWLIFGWSKSLSSILNSITSKQYLLVAGMGIILGGILMLLTLPLSYYEGYKLPHQFGMSNQSIKDWIFDEVKGLLLGLIIGGVILEVIYLVLELSPNYWWLWAALFMLFFNVLLANLAPILLFPIFYKFTPLSDDYQALKERLLSLAQKAGTKVSGVYKFDMSKKTKAANAALAGLGNTRRIILGDTLLKEFTPDEIETVLAHELGHQVHKDIPLGILVQSTITLVGFYLANVGLHWGIQFFNFSKPSDIAAMPLFALILIFYGIITMPLVNAYSRKRELLADQYALEITQNGNAFASALTRLANQNLADADPEPWVEFLLYSHPSLSKRIQLAEEYQEKSGYQSPASH